MSRTLLLGGGVQEIFVHRPSRFSLLVQFRTSGSAKPSCWRARDLAIQEAAARSEIEPGTYKNRLWRGQQRLRKLTEDSATRLLSNRPKIEPPARPKRRERHDWQGVMIG